MEVVSQRYIIERFCAAHCNYQGSNKDWIGVLVHVVNAGSDPTSDETPEAKMWMFLSAYGKSGGNLQGGEISTPTTRREAEGLFEAKVKEKLKKHHYYEVEFAPFLSAFKVPLVMPETGTSDADVRTGKESEQTQREMRPADSLPVLGYESNRAEAISSWQIYANSSYGATEKANGERCIVSYDEQRLIQGYNRNGEPSRTVPASAHALTSLATSFVLDGERLVGQQEGQYVVFDVLQWNGEDIRSWPCSLRIATIQEAFKRAGLIKEMVPTPTLGKAFQNSLMTDLMLLTPAKGAENIGRVVNVVRQRAGEGVIIRQLAASYTSPKAVLKYKFTADIDAVVIGVKPGPGGGSLKLGLRRGSDNAIVTCGHVRSGLTNQDVSLFAERLAQGIWSVLKVRYLPSRTSGVTLVESSTSREWIRDDKDPWSCTTDQLGEEKASLIAQAPSIPGLFFPKNAHAS